jgi:hypothetical protein
MRWTRHIKDIVEKRSAHKILLGKPRRRWEDNIKLHLKEVELDAVG